MAATRACRSGLRSAMSATCTHGWLGYTVIQIIEICISLWAIQKTLGQVQQVQQRVDGFCTQKWRLGKPAVNMI